MKSYNSFINLYKSDSKSVNTSKKSSFGKCIDNLRHSPFKCPIIPCGRLITPNITRGHFLMDHFEIKTLDCSFEEIYTISICPGRLKTGDVRCLGLFKMFTKQEYNTRKEFESDEKTDNQRLSCTLMLSKYAINPSNNFLVLWSTHLSNYRVQAVVKIQIRCPSTSSVPSSLTYQGPVEPMLEQKSVSEVFMNGGCLAISPWQLGEFLDEDQMCQILITFCVD
uniref:Uncharacterized protein n=1 Tax=Clastoptera arizonana TaxID=38151 RepID=A0A1B6CYM8_9HEMI